MNGMQCRMARAGLDWSGKELSERAGVRPATISAFEKGGAALTTTVDKLREAFLVTSRVRFEGETGVFVQPFEG
ncbi:helix-turn-helix domain-containing protein [Microbulbifer variabilis]|uniref:Helix-turn-helix domain-containing protein n=1 Tax=Microbulbifer variabilis TaxID=266805 RepID=A0ABY4VKZ6_9GAMM|nr:helix-turn-helix transcriptional regulator [Microbulbifer variabilis]USD22569.1 helix-turn-helix domain-containing protein [Microbulbifer variabilis]